jgi:hypothetical protein
LSACSFPGSGTKKEEEEEEEIELELPAQSVAGRRKKISGTAASMLGQDQPDSCSFHCKVWTPERFSNSDRNIGGLGSDRQFPQGQGSAPGCYRQFIILCCQLNLFLQAMVAMNGSKSKTVNNPDGNFTSAKVLRWTSACSAPTTTWIRHSVTAAEPHHTLRFQAPMARSLTEPLRPPSSRSAC